MTTCKMIRQMSHSLLLRLRTQAAAVQRFERYRIEHNLRPTVQVVCNLPDHAQETRNRYLTKVLCASISFSLTALFGVLKATCGKDDKVIQKRTEYRSQQKTESPFVLRSLQKCTLNENLQILYDQEERVDERQKQKLRGLQAVLLELLHTNPDDTHQRSKSCLPFQEAFDIFMGYQNCKGDYNTRDQRVYFRDALLHPKTGLCVNIITTPNADRFVSLKPDNLDMTPVYDSILSSSEAKEEQSKSMTSTEVKDLISSMSTDWDKNCLRYALTHDKSKRDAYRLGIGEPQARKVKAEVPTVLEAIKSTNVAAQDMVDLRLSEKQAKLEKQIDDNKNLIERKRGLWPERKIKDIEADIELDHLRLDGIIKLQEKEPVSEKRKYNQMVRRQTKTLIKENRLGMRALGNQGRPQAIDEEIEDAIVKSIEDISSYHGRRHEATQFLNHRVKGRDLLYTANALLAEAGKNPVRSATTIWNRSKPQRQNSIQARQHIGRGLWCTKKPPKAEENDNECTHYQRSHINNIKRFFFSTKAGNMSQYVLMRSIDDKAYLRPGTGEGMDKARNQRILTPVAEERARKLPIHDWPERLVCVTPSTHRVFSKEGKIVGEKESLFTKDDNHFVFVRPKHYIGSSGTVWANEAAELRYLHPDIFEVCSGENKYSTAFRSICNRIKDEIFLYKDMSVGSDYKRIKPGNISDKYTAYELQRLDHLQHRLQIAMEKCQEDEMTEGEQMLFKNHIGPRMERLQKELRSTVHTISETITHQTTIDKVFQEFLQVCNFVSETVEELKLPAVKPIWCDLSDAGPGVSVTNFEVGFRDVELARCYNSDYRFRGHRSREDSCQNEAERTNSAIGDAIVDGGSLKWQYFLQFDGLSDEDVSKLTVKEFERIEDKRMEKNAWQVCEDVKQRIDGAPVMSEYVIAYVTSKSTDSFFFNRANLDDYNKASQKMKVEIPGSGYIKKILKFYQHHVERGELYMEFMKMDCQRISGAMCEFCQKSPRLSPLNTRVPRPMPDHDNVGHYKDVFETPLVDSRNQPRAPDDWQPRANIKKLFAAGKLQNDKEVEEFSKSFMVDAHLVEKYVKHLRDIKLRQNMKTVQRQQDKKETDTKAYKDYNWPELVLSGKLRKLQVKELDKYLDHHNINKVRKTKKEKIDMIVSNIKIVQSNTLANTLISGQTLMEAAEEEVTSSDSDCESEFEVVNVTHDYDYSDSDGSDHDNSDLGDPNISDHESNDVPDRPERLTVTTRSGRIAKAFRL